MGVRESKLAVLLAHYLLCVRPPTSPRIRHCGADGTEKSPSRIWCGFADVAFVSQDRLPGRPLPPILDLSADLAVEVLSPSNTKAEIARKLHEYFEGGTRLAWIVDHRAGTVRVHTSPTEFVTLTAADTLDGGAVLPGFALPLADLFAQVNPGP